MPLACPKRSVMQRTEFTSFIVARMWRGCGRPRVRGRGSAPRASARKLVPMSSAIPLNVGIARSADAAGAGAEKRVLLAEPRGYCAGVDRAVETVERTLDKHGAPVYVRHEIVHNRYVVETLAKAGAIFDEQTVEV